MPILILGLVAFLFIGGGIAMAQNKNSPGYKLFGENWYKYDHLFTLAASKYGVPFKWLKAIAMNESSLGLNEKVKSGGVSDDGKSWGLMQFTIPTARDFDGSATPQKLNDSAYSIDLAGQFLAQLSKQFSGDERKVIMSYNQGAGNTRAGKVYAASYYAKWLANVTIVEQG